MIDFIPCLYAWSRKEEKERDRVRARARAREIGGGGKERERDRDRECIQRECLWNWERQSQNGGPVKKALWLRVFVCAQHVCARVPGCIPLRIKNVTATLMQRILHNTTGSEWTRRYGLYYSVTIVPTPTGRGASLVLHTLNCAHHPPNIVEKRQLFSMTAHYWWQRRLAHITVTTPPFILSPWTLLHAAHYVHIVRILV
jgi:hypothetical protein